MSTTINVDVTSAKEWVIVKSADTEKVSGVFSIAMSGQHCITTSLPERSFVGHRFAHDTSFSLEIGEKLCVKVDRPTAIVITEG